MDETFEVSFNIKNTSSVDSDETSQIYMSAPSQLPEDGSKFALKTLVGFERVYVKAGGTVAVSVVLPLR